jgi:uncharacterized alpha-E superfamily protein
MLARTAESLFWLARYLERADYVARLLQGAGHMSAARVDADRSSEWESAIIAAGCQDAFAAEHEQVSAAAVIHYLAFDTRNPSSIVSCIETARRNARTVRTALTADMWDAVNSTWLELRGFDTRQLDDDRIATFLDWVKVRSRLFHGVYTSTMLRADGYHFTRLGQFLERADNSARLLDVKYHVRLPNPEDVGGLVDYYQWLAILRVVGARRAYRVLFKGQVTPIHVAELMILRPEFPRSLVFCFEQITTQLDKISGQDAQRSAEGKRLAHSLYAQLRFGRIDHIFSSGLHEYLTDVIERSDELGREIANGYLF